jgi:two-component system, chemotaxis family, CheB/CheR fusion protein
MKKPDSSYPTEPRSSETQQTPLSSDKSSKPWNKPAIGFPIVGVGASAGGLKAFEQFFTHLQENSGMAYIVIQHLSAPSKSILPEILQRYTNMPVIQINDMTDVEPDHVYVIPPGSDLVLQDGQLRLFNLEPGKRYSLPIDRFFRSLAVVQGTQAIGIVLSGTLNDGSLGLKSIKAEGGLTIAQDPDTAEFADMPRSAIATQDVDYILPPHRMGELILKYVHHDILEGYRRGSDEVSIPEAGLQKLFFLLRSKTGHDFSQYKKATILRRIERRLKVNLIQDLEEYIRRLEDHPEEIEALFQEILINVTHFFRDPEAFQALSEKAIGPLIAQKQTDKTPLRVWDAACSSGEEVYSLAICIQEQIEAQKVDCKVQIYATDLDKHAIDAARKGFYSQSSIENVSPERLQRFFHQEDHGYQVKKGIRDMIVFSTQNLISDPPYSRIDLLCCRNILIYLELELQIQLLRQFHYSLNPGGILFLGNSESTGRNNELFNTLDSKNRIFKSKEIDTQRRLQIMARPAPRKALNLRPDLARKLPTSGGLRDWIERVLLEYHTPAAVIIDTKNNILFIHGHTGKFLEPAPGEGSSNLVRMAREGLKTELANALHKASLQIGIVRREGVKVKTNGQEQTINLIVRPVDGLPDVPGFLVVFEEVKPLTFQSALESSKAEPVDYQVAQLQKALQDKDEYLNSVINDLETANQDLNSANDELQSYNEELQSTNEELETSKEELESVNEELTTINAELQIKNEELGRINNDIHNFLNSTEIATLFVDLDLRIRRFTPQIQKIYKILPTDTGRSIGDLVSNLTYDRLDEDIQEVLWTLVPKTIEVQAKGGAWYMININIYRTLENVVDGIVITFVDVTQQKKADELRRMATILRDSNDAITVQDFDGKILAWNRGAFEMYGWSEAEALAMNSQDLVSEYKRLETLDLYRRLAQGETIRSFETQRVRSDGQILDVWVTLTALVDEANQPVGIATTERDVTDRRQAQLRVDFENRALKAISFWYKTLLEHPQNAALSNEACRILAEDVGYRMAWIGRIEKNQANNISPAAWAGLAADDLDAKQMVRALANQNQMPVERALSSRRPFPIRHIPTNSEAAALRADALQGRYSSLIALPLIHRNELIGVLVIYAVEPEAFMDSEVDVLMRLSESIAQFFALD